MENQGRRLRSLAVLTAGVGVYLVAPTQALARALVRFIHAVPAVGDAEILVTQGGTETKVGTVGFGQATAWRGIHSGRFEWSVDKGGKTLADGTATVGNGAYDLVLLAEAKGVQLGVFRSESAAPGTTLVRVIHAAPELGAPELSLDSKIVLKSLSFTHATPYLSVNPGVHSLAALKAGDTAPLVDLDNVRLLPSVAYSAVVVGSQGQRVRIVTLTDRGAPLTRRARAASTPAGPAKPAPAAKTSTTGRVTVQQGDSLWTIAGDQLGAGASDEAVAEEVVAIWNLNQSRIGTGDPDLIFPGTQLQLPAD